MLSPPFGPRGRTNGGSRGSSSLPISLRLGRLFLATAHALDAYDEKNNGQSRI